MNEHQVKEKHGDVELKIMNAARDVFAEMGFGGARMDEIARRAGVNKATIYYHIGDKKELYAEVIHQVIGNTTDRIAENISRAATSEEKIVIIKTIAEAMDLNPQMPPLIMREIASGGDNLPDVFVLEDFARLIGIVKSILDEGGSAGVFAETSPLILHLMVVSTFAVYSMTTPIREKLQGISGNLLLPDNKLSGYFADEVAAMIVKALRRSQ